MVEHLYPALFALCIWWLSTGVIIYLDGLPQRTFKWSMLGATLVLAGSLYGLAQTANDTTITGAYLAFTFGLLAWGWQTISFFMGFITGPRKEACPDDCHGLIHFWHGVEVGLWHDLAIIVAFAVIVTITWGADNQIGLWTFVVLWWMHQSAKLNVFFGVRNLSEEFLPDHLAYLKRYLTKRPMNLFFPISVTVSTVVCYVLFERAFAADASPFESAGYTFLAVLMALAILEHWFLVLPLPFSKLWHWWLNSRNSKGAFDLEIAMGFLGSGKTSFLNQRFGEKDLGEKTVALIDDVAEHGIDETLLNGDRADGVELPNGSYCCALDDDVVVQLKTIANSHAPDRIVIEPSGVADMASLMSALNQRDIRRLTKTISLYSIIDANAFLRVFAQMPGYFRTQAALNPVFIVNKADLVDDATLQVISDKLVSLNPNVDIKFAVHGVVDDSLDIARNRPVKRNQAETTVSATCQQVDVGIDGSDVQRNTDNQVNPSVVLGLKSFSATLSAPCEVLPLLQLLDSIASGGFGQIERVKGIARSGNGWVRFDVAGGRPSITAFSAMDDERPRVFAIGNNIDGDGLKRAFGSCQKLAA